MDLPAITVELRLSGLIGTASHPDIKKIRIIGFFFEIRQRWQFEFRLLTVYNMYLRLNTLTKPDLTFQKP
jgi:hypothetical protein